MFGITLAQLVQWLINFGMKTPTILGLGVGGAFGTYVVAIIIAVAVSEFIGRCIESATVNKEKKEFNYNTHTYDSEKNGKLKRSEKTEENRIQMIKKSQNSSKNIKKDTKNAKIKQINANLKEKEAE